MKQEADDDGTTLGESVVDEVRTIREAIDKDVGHDVRRLAERARRTGEEVRAQYGLKAERPLAAESVSRPNSPSNRHG